ncbi:hypothetical protein M917_0049 [Psychrobacter aquaticus CMS 56]|uniref:Uncharacterized protein n=1 Tax=Psychrobacter aquaticus CMS 56 TaxID=1354303 RepID=U4T6Q4_9GAMM|nr:hypothetical protein M917_0049 [Psychrobacter aquaticus CMS 56]
MLIPSYRELMTILFVCQGFLLYDSHRLNASYSLGFLVF